MGALRNAMAALGLLAVVCVPAIAAVPPPAPPSVHGVPPLPSPAPATSAAAAARAQRADEAAVRAIVADFHQSLSENYKEGALRLLAEDAVVFETGYVEARDGYAEGHLDADLLFAATVKRDPVHTSVVVDGDLAYVLTQARRRGAFKGSRVDLENTETMVLRRIGGKWKIVHIHWSGHERQPGAH